MSALTEGDAERWIFDNAFATDQIGRIGLELEWLVFNTVAPHERVLPSTIRATTSVSAISFEPGGQVELSPPPSASLSECITSTAQDLTLLRHEIAAAGFELVGSGLDPRPPARIGDDPRYGVLEAHYERFGHAGKIMMCNTASVQVNIDAGDSSDGWRGRQRRWWLANSLGPVLVAMFANSPRSAYAAGRSCRQILRFHTDPSRTNPPTLNGECREEWTRYAMDANVIGFSQGENGHWTLAPPGLTMRRWIKGAGPRPPSLTDLRHHLKAVIPPVRACGHLELRMIDAQPDDFWMVPAAVVGALLDEPSGSDNAVDIAAHLPGAHLRELWIVAARSGMADPALAATAKACMRIALTSLQRLDLPTWAMATIEEFAQRFTFKSRCPADDPSAVMSGRFWLAQP